ncbi:MAG TPA: hypothetical protein VI462_13365 [Acidimicrobiia bacterium]
MYPLNYALAAELEHPRTVYVREELILPPLDRWLAGVFDPDRIDETCEQLAAAASEDTAKPAELEAARRKLTDCDQRLARYRSALESGADPVVVAGWIAEVQAERGAAERVVAQLQAHRPIDGAELRSLVEGLADIPAVLADAEPSLRAQVYADLGITMTYRPGDDLVEVVATPCTKACVGGATRPLRTRLGICRIATTSLAAGDRRWPLRQVVPSLVLQALASQPAASSAFRTRVRHSSADGRVPTCAPSSVSHASAVRAGTWRKSAMMISTPIFALKMRPTS